MQLDLDPDHVVLQDTVSRFCAAEFDRHVVRSFGEPGGFDRERWRRLCELGVFALSVPEARGGLGLSQVETVLVFEELGRALVPGPLIACQLGAGAVDGVMDGTRIATVIEDRGPVRMVEHLDAADVVLIVRDDGVWMADAVTVRARASATSVDPTARVSIVEDVPRGELLVDHAGLPAWQLAADLVVAAALLGVSAAATDVATAYAQDRRQFGRQISSFQAIKHMLADCFARTEVARAAVYAAALMHAEHADADSSERAVASARVLTERAAIANAKTCVQVHGGMGFTDEIDAHLYVKRAWALAATLGSADRSALVAADRLAAAVGAR